MTIGRLLVPCCRIEKHVDCVEEGTKKVNYDANRRTSFRNIVKTISLKTGSSKQRTIAAEIRKLGNSKASPHVFTFYELAAATANFHPNCLIGEGGFGRVYKGYIKNIDKDVAVKQLDRNGLQGSREFCSEVLMLSHVEHPNLVNLIGYCADGDQRVLVYEFMPNESLENQLFDLDLGTKPLDWFTRMKIAEGAARGLEYLHDVADPPVIFRDFKASNILLDENFNPKLSDFGLAKFGPTGSKEHVSTRVMGTYGYCSPEYALTGQLTTKSDVYSFGVVLLELVTGRRAVDSMRPTEEQNLIDWAEPMLKDRSMFCKLVDPLLKGKYPEKGLNQTLAISAMCLQAEARTRPLIGDVVSALQFLVQPSQSYKKRSVKDTSRKNSQCSYCVQEGNSHRARTVIDMSWRSKKEVFWNWKSREESSLLI